MAKKAETFLIPMERIEKSILLIRGDRVILDADLAALYGVTTARLNQQVRRNIDRFPEDSAFLLTSEEFANLKLHFATSSSGWGGRRKPPLAFTKHGALMAANVLKTSTAVKTSLQVVRTFVRQDAGRSLGVLPVRARARPLRSEDQLCRPRGRKCPAGIVCQRQANRLLDA